MHPMLFESIRLQYILYITVWFQATYQPEDLSITSSPTAAVLHINNIN